MPDHPGKRLQIESVQRLGSPRAAMTAHTNWDKHQVLPAVIAAWDTGRTGATAQSRRRPPPRIWECRNRGTH
jgi:hypothetical protein